MALLESHDRTRALHIPRIAVFSILLFLGVCLLGGLGSYSNVGEFYGANGAMSASVLASDQSPGLGKSLIAEQWLSLEDLQVPQNNSVALLVMGTTGCEVAVSNEPKMLAKRIGPYCELAADFPNLRPPIL